MIVDDEQIIIFEKKKKKTNLLSEQIIYMKCVTAFLPSKTIA